MLKNPAQITNKKNNPIPPDTLIPLKTKTKTKGTDSEVYSM